MRLSMIVLTVGTALSAAGCETLKPYEKEHLLDPSMDDQATAALASELMPAAAQAREKLALGGAGGVGGTSCPTCGG